NVMSQQDLDDAKTTLDTATAKLEVNKKAYDLAVNGPRQEDIDEAEANLAAKQQMLALMVAGPRQEDIKQAEAQLRANQAQAALLHQHLADAQLFAPAN